MSEEEIIETFKHWIEYEKANKDKIYKADELIEIQQGLLDLYQQEKEKNGILKDELNNKINALDIAMSNPDYISKDKIKEKIEELEKQAENVRGLQGLRYSESGYIQSKINVLEELLERR